MSNLLPVYSRIDLAFEQGSGSWLRAASGESYLDFTSGIAVNALGHAHPKLVEVLAKQARKLWHVSNLFSVPEQERLARRLCETTFADVVFFGNSGSEAIECALKMARKHFSSRGERQRYRVLSFSGAFHGRTLAALAAGGREEHLEGFHPRMPGFDQVAYGDIDAVESAITEETAAILIEPVQGEGGVRVALPAFLPALRELADKRGVLLIFDEVQCGVGRTGKLFAYEWYGIRPDIMAVGKGMGGGFPVGACLATRSAASGMTIGTHGSTYGGNPLAMVVAEAVLEIVDDSAFLAHVASCGADMKRRLLRFVESDPDLIEDVRGLGLMLGLQCKVPPAEMAGVLRAEGLLTVPSSGGVVRFLPPLTVSDAEIEHAISCVSRACGRLRAQGQDSVSRN